MFARFIGGLGFGAALLALAVTAQPAAAQSNSMFEFLSGGAPTGKRFGLFGMQEIPRSTVRFDGGHKPGTIVINTAERRLYLVQATAARCATASASAASASPGRACTDGHRRRRNGRPGRRRRRCCKRRPGLPRHMAGGVDNPLGARAHVSRRHALPHPRLERAGDDRPGGVVGLLPHDQRGREATSTSGCGSAPR